MRCPLIQLGVTVEEIRNRLNNPTDDHEDERVEIVTMMSSDNIQGDHGDFRHLISDVLNEEFTEWYIYVSAPRGEKIILCFVRPSRNM